MQLSVAAAKAGFTGASSEEREHFRDQLLQGTETISLYSCFSMKLFFLL